MPGSHPLRRMRELSDAALKVLDGAFSELYSPLGRPSIPPERLLRASLLQLLYSIRSERQLMERLEFDLLFRWFVGLGIDDAVMIARYKGIASRLVIYLASYWREVDSKTLERWGEVARAVRKAA